MKNEKMINVNDELDKMREYITDIKRCTDKVKELNSSAQLHQTNIKMTVLSVLVTVFAVASAVKRNDIVVVSAGVILALIIWLLRKTDVNKEYNLFSLLAAASIMTSIVFFMILYNAVPVVFLLCLWVYVIWCNYTEKKQIWAISNNL